MKTKYKKCLLMMLSLTTAALIIHAGGPAKAFCAHAVGQGSSLTQNAF